MSTRWEHLAGDTGEFALKLAFARDPDNGQGADPDVGPSWGSFQLWVDGRNLCAHQDQGERSESVHWHLLPLMEWFVRHWNPLLHEERLPARNEGDTAWDSLRATRFPPAAIGCDEQQASRWEAAWQAWWQRHALRSASAGGLFPDVVLRRVRDFVEISWGSACIQGMPDHFDFAESQGVYRLSPQAVADPAHEVLRGASEHLLSLRPNSDRLRALSASVAALRSAERHSERRLMWLAGLGTDERTILAGWRRVKSYLGKCAEGPRDAMLKAAESPLAVTGSCQAALMFGSLAPTVRRKDVLEIAQTMVDLYDPEEAPQPIDRIRRAVPIERFGGPAWLQAQELAEDLHERLDRRLEDDSLVDIDAVLERLGVSVVERDLSDDSIRGIALVGSQHRPGVLVNPRHSANQRAAGRRFTLAHELCHLLFDGDVGTHLAIASGPWAPRDVERRANAFAAMFLMPPQLVQSALSRLTGQLTTATGVLAVANRLQTSFLATLRHLNNLGYIDRVARQRIEREAVPGQAD